MIEDDRRAFGIAAPAGDLRGWVDDMDDQRRCDRRDARVAGRIAPERGGPRLFCWVHDLSDDGAKVELIDAGRAPAEFHLEIDGTGEPFRARTVWRDGPTLGVRFLEPVGPESNRSFSARP